MKNKFYAISRDNISKVALLILSALLFFAGCSIRNDVNSPEDIHGRRIGGLEGTPSIRFAAEYGTAIAFRTQEEMMEALRSGDVDCVIMESSTAEELVAKTSRVRILLEPLVRYDLCFAIPKENSRLLKAVDSALETLQRNGTLRGLYNKYFAGRNYTYRPPDNSAQKTGTLSVALPPDSPPLSYKDDEGRFIGMDVEVAIALGDILGVNIEAMEYDSWELATAVWHGRADLALGWRPGEGEGIVNMSIPYAEVIQVIIVRR